MIPRLVLFTFLLLRQLQEIWRKMWKFLFFNNFIFVYFFSHRDRHLSQRPTWGESPEHNTKKHNVSA